MRIWSFSIGLVYSVLLFNVHVTISKLHPTHNFKSLPLNASNFQIQMPYNLNATNRYNFSKGVHKLWVLADDKPHALTSNTSARTEIRIQGHDYSTGVWQFEGHAYVPIGTSGVCIMQVFGSGIPNRATTLMLRVYNGALMYYRRVLIADEIYGRWFKVNVIHDTTKGIVKVFIDEDLKLVTTVAGGVNHYFKCGVYMQNNGSYFMESRWKRIRVLKLSD